MMRPPSNCPAGIRLSAVTRYLEQVYFNHTRPASPNFHSPAPCDRLFCNTFIQATDPKFCMSEAAIRENSLVLYRARPLCLKLPMISSAWNWKAARAPKFAYPRHPAPPGTVEKPRRAAAARRRCADRLGDPGRKRHHLGGVGGVGLRRVHAEHGLGSLAGSQRFAIFCWTPERIMVCSAEEVAHTQAYARPRPPRNRPEAFVARAKAGKVAPEDRRYLRDVEDLALGRNDRSRVLKALGRENCTRTPTPRCYFATRMRRSIPTLPAMDYVDDAATAAARTLG